MTVIGKKVDNPLFQEYTPTGAIFQGKAVITFQDDPEDELVEVVTREFYFEVRATELEGKTKAQKLAYLKAQFALQLDAEEARATGERAVADMGAEDISLPVELP